VSEDRVKVRWWVWLIIGAVLIAVIGAVIYWWQPLYDFVSDREQVRSWIEGLGAWGPIAIVFLEMIQALLAPIPGQAIEAVSGYLYGPWLGTLYPMIGMAIGSFITFSLARRFGRPLVVKLIGQQSMARLDDLERRGGAPFFFLIWLLPFAPDDLACVAAGLTPMPAGQFMVLMILGRLPGVFVSVWVGANVAQIELVWWVVLFGAIAIAALVLWRWGDQIQEAVLGFIERLSNRFRR
jgi:uncharacterized membrane protein YdjX (TVP38/TMEM64 family)